MGGMLPAQAETDAIDTAKPPTQIVLVDWLQFLRKAFTERVGGTHKPRVGIVVAAWDLAPNEQKAAGPGAWVAANLSLLSQFIQANDDEFDFQYFGVSVASGDLNSDDEFRKAYMEGNPRTAGQVTHSLSGAVETSPDMTLPVAWAMSVVDTNLLGSAR
jgi:hypothetical protein